MTATIEPLTLPPDALDFARRQEELRDHILGAFGVPAGLLEGACFSSLTACAYEFSRRRDEARERFFARLGFRGLIFPLMRASLPAQLRRRIDALLRKGSGRTSRLRKKLADARREAARLFWGHFGLPGRPCLAELSPAAPS